jgi:hypothetical protein
MARMTGRSPHPQVRARAAWLAQLHLNWACASVAAAVLTLGVVATSPAAPDAIDAGSPVDVTATVWRQRLVGTWVLTSLYDEDETGEEIDQWSFNPYGRLSFDRDGRFAVRLQDGLGFGLCIAYAGTYEPTADRKIRFHPDSFAFPGHDETDRVATPTWRDGQLDLISSALPSLAGSFYSRTVWQYTGATADTSVSPCGRQVVKAPLK